MREQHRIDFLVGRDGADVTRAWVEQTLRIYRRAVLNKSTFASSPAYRREFIQACCDFRRWLAATPACEPGAATQACCGNVACETCQAEVPISEAKSAEAVDYVVYFCGLDCYQKWLKGDKMRATQAGWATPTTWARGTLAIADSLDRHSAGTKMKRFKIGDRVSWNSEAGRVRGRILRVHTADVTHKGYVHHASQHDPQYEIKSDKTAHVALHKGRALTKLTD